MITFHSFCRCRRRKNEISSGMIVLTVGVVVLQVAADGARPVEVRQAAERAVLAAVERAADRLGESRLQALPQLLDHPAHQVAGRGLRLFRDQVLQLQHRAGQVDGRLDLGQDLRLEQQLLHAAPFDGVLLQQDHDVLGEEVADLVEPARDPRHRAALHRTVRPAFRRRFPLVAADFLVRSLA